MKPLRLQLGGFTCFREDTQVSFDDLYLFAIEGPTGSGKSTLLDAITYALYGQTPRLGMRGLDALLSPGLSQMYVVFEFEVGQGQAYRVTRTLDKKTGRIEPNVRVQELVGGNWRQLPESEKIKEANAKLRDIVGLDYDGFTRAVILPQGDFSRFLHGGSESKKLLTKLLGLERVAQMQREAGQRAREADTRRRGIEERLEQDFAGATPERLRELKDTLAGLREQKGALEQERTGLAERLQEQDEVKALLDEQAGVKARLAELEAKAEECRRDAAALAAARQAALIVPQLQELGRKRSKLGELRAAHQGSVERRAALLPAQEQAQAALRAAEQEAGRLPELARQAEALAGVRPLLEQLKARGGDLSLAGRADGATPYSDAAWDDLQAQRHLLPSLERALRDVAEAEKAQSGAEKALAETERGAEALARELEAVREKGRLARERFNAAEEAHRQAELSDRAAALRPHLHVGEPCPVCEQTVSELPAGAGVELAGLARARDEAKAALDELLEAYGQTQSDLNTARSRLEDRRAAAESARQALLRHQEHLTEVRQGFTPPAGADAQELARALEERRSLLLAALAVEIRERAQGLDPERGPGELKAERERIEAGLRAAQERLGRVDGELQALQARLELEAEQVRERQAELGAAEDAFAALLEQAGFASADEVERAALPQARLQALEARIRAHENDLETTRRREVELQSKLAGRTLDEAEYAAAKARRGELERDLESVQQRLGASEQLLQDVQDQLERARDLRAELKCLLENYETYRQLSLDLQSDRFPDYLLSRVQGELAVRASKIIRNVTDGRYDLRLEGGEYQVIDAWNTGEPRSAKTLSGGETFIASLALALALSDTVAGSASLGALFLDEGFGTLDAETLDSVAGVLESLTSEGRMVGVITHVTALTQRLPARLRVRKGQGGSQVAWDA